MKFTSIVTISSSVQQYQKVTLKPDVSHKILNCCCPVNFTKYNFSTQSPFIYLMLPGLTLLVVLTVPLE